MIDEERLKVFKNSVGLFAIVDYNTPSGITTAKGRLMSVSGNGNVLIQHLNNPQVSWGFNIDEVENYKFSPIKEKKGVFNGSP